MKKIIIIAILLCPTIFWTQAKEWHVRPYTDNYNNIAGNDGTTFQKAMCLQFALTGGGGSIQPGDIIWLHGDNKSTYVGTPGISAVYKGHFRSTLSGGLGEPNYITVSSYPGEWAVIDGNIHNPTDQSGSLPIINGVQNSDMLILEVLGGNVRFQNFEITCLGNFSRIKDTRPVNSSQGSPLCASTIPPAYNFHEYVGIQHWAPNIGSSIRNEFRNLVFRNIPGIAIGSWKFTRDTEIYGNIFYNNGIIEVTGPVGCTPLAQVPLTPANCRGHQTCIYTQNSTDVNRIIRNNIFLNCYDSGVNIWSANNATDIVNNYVVSKNSFINNGSPVRDETANMIVSANGGRINHITVNSNLFYINDTSSFVSGLKVDFVTDINISNNYFFNGTTFMQIYGTNHAVTFEHNLYVGKYFQLNSNIANYQGTAPGLTAADRWHMDFNTYYTWFPYIHEVPTLTAVIPPASQPIEKINLNYDPAAPAARYFKKSTDYNDELNSTWTFFENKHRYFDPTSPLVPRYFIVQNEYNPNVFYVSVYNPMLVASAFSVDFTSYSIPSGKTYKIKDSQNYLMATSPIAQGTYTSGSINFPIPVPDPSIFAPGNFELPLPTSGTSFGPAYIPTTAPPVHSNQDFNTYVIEFDCNFAYKKYDDFIATNDNSVKSYLAKHNIAMGPNYTTSTGADVSATAGNQITIKPDAWISSGTKFLGKIGDPCTDLTFIPALSNAAFDMGSGLNRSANNAPKEDSGEKALFSIYPNPTSGIFSIQSLNSKKIKHAIISKIEASSITFEEFYDYQKTIDIDISKEKSGLYIVEVFFEDNTSQTKTLIKK